MVIRGGWVTLVPRARRRRDEPSYILLHRVVHDIASITPRQQIPHHPRAQTIPRQHQLRLGARFGVARDLPHAVGRALGHLRRVRHADGRVELDILVAAAARRLARADGVHEHALAAREGLGAAAREEDVHGFAGGGGARGEAAWGFAWWGGGGGGGWVGECEEGEGAGGEEGWC